MIGAEKSDLYGVLAYIAFALAPLTRQERANGGKSAIQIRYGDKLKTLLNFVLAQYVRKASANLTRTNCPT